ncbi:HlyD family efflux transporter periplasmic adaptor subunit [Primorskyibacter aestuariivivens]|uniref:efflux RND transporter periplasmic adaptor subunit n=1 Tax=Primorskyibacter aestuariivivens TaxID=1888912 RepID=UPI002300EA4A|nr:HlyD family efflux transporter periplasmic adaptor subunit [Primorskyibacter aestuariivivens]MDA7428605.1 HlyD family efflux transporter periplasmic adaptor subunit [Primorskyibacter aestuariivivens]
MPKHKKISRAFLTLAALTLVAAGLAAAFWPRPVLVDLGEVTQGPMVVTIDEEGRTRVREPFIVSTPVAGRLQRVQVHPGDPVIKDETVVAHMLPTNPAALDLRTREQAQAMVQAAEAALRVAKADHNSALASLDLARTELQRTETLAEREIASAAALERKRQSFRIAEAQAQTTEAAIAMREADLANARARLIDFDDRAPRGADGVTNGGDIPLYAPANGRVLRVMQESETTLPAGAPVMEIGNVEDDLEVVVELISSDAVKIRVGDRVIIDNWGGPVTLDGEVRRIDPLAISKYSALGVEEQRVPITVALTGPSETHRALGHGYRIEARIIVWQSDNAIRVPSSALFRERGSWAAFTAHDGLAHLTPVEIGHNNGRVAEVLNGLESGDQVILYPSAAVRDRIAIAERVAE